MLVSVEGLQLLWQELSDVAEDQIAHAHHHVGLEGVAEDLRQQLVLVASDVDLSQCVKPVHAHLHPDLMLVAVVMLNPCS